MPLFHVLLQVEGKGGGFSTLEEIPEDLQAGGCVQFPAYGGKLGKVGDEVGAHTGKIGAGLEMCIRDRGKYTQIFAQNSRRFFRLSIRPVQRK